MEEKESVLKNYAEQLVHTTEPLEIYQSLLPIFDKAELYQEYAGLLEKIYNITMVPDLFKQIGDIMLNKVKNEKVAKIAYGKFVELYQSKNDYKISELQRIVDRFSVIGYIMIYFYNKKMYHQVLETSKQLSLADDNVKKYYSEHPDASKEPLDDVMDISGHLSNILSKVKHHNDINWLSICLNNNNLKAYLNILEDLIHYGNYRQALDFYNFEYRKIFHDACPFNSIVQLCWFMSEKYTSAGEIYNSVMMQKRAIDIEFSGDLNDK